VERLKVKDVRKDTPMATRGKKNIGLSIAAAGIGIIGVAVVFGLTTADGGPDWVGIVTAIAGIIMVVTGSFRAIRGGTPHTA
jgi:hypothetical protein